MQFFAYDMSQIYHISIKQAKVIFLFKILLTICNPQENIPFIPIRHKHEKAARRQ